MQHGTDASLWCVELIPDGLANCWHIGQEHHWQQAGDIHRNPCDGASTLPEKSKQITSRSQTSQECKCLELQKIKWTFLWTLLWIHKSVFKKVSGTFLIGHKMKIGTFEPQLIQGYVDINFLYKTISTYYVGLVKAIPPFWVSSLDLFPGFIDLNVLVAMTRNVQDVLQSIAYSDETFQRNRC